MQQVHLPSKLTGLLTAALLAVSVVATATPAAADTWTGTLREAVRLLAVAPERNAGYDREGAFGGWIDADGDCQSTRHEVLIAESTVPVTLSASGCTAVSGRWVLPFEGGAVATAAGALEVDHFVPLAEAWGSGAQGWTQERRVAFANDLSAPSLNASSSAWNQAKGAKGPEEFVPTSATCLYVAHWVGVKLRWGLNVDDVERSALLRYADVQCPPQSLTVELAGTSTPVLPPPPTTPATPVPDAPGAKRLAGGDRYATAAAIVRDSFASGTVPVAFVASGQGFADALAGGPAAAQLGGPVLPVTRTAVPAAVRTELARLQPGRIVVLGGTSAVSGTVATQLDAFTTGPVTRLAGSTRYGTAAQIATSTFRPGVPQVLVATGAGFADALAGGAAAALGDGPVLLVGRSSVPAETAAALRTLRPGTISVLGGPSAVSDAVLQQLRSYTTGAVDRLAGSDRASTAARIAQVFWPQGSDVVYLATGRDFPDALAGVPAAGLDRAPLLLVERGCMPAATKREVERLRPTTTVVLGGTTTVNAAAAGGAVCAAAPPATAPTTPSQPGIPPRPADVDCADFTTQAAAQAFYDRWFPYYGDVARLDGSDQDGRVCETLP